MIATSVVVGDVEGEEADVVAGAGREPDQQLVAQLVDRRAGKVGGDGAELGEAVSEVSVATFDKDQLLARRWGRAGSAGGER